MISTQDQPQICEQSMPSLEPLVSVIIPVFNDAKRLRRCLAALDQQTYCGDRYEVIVVDNGSDEDVAGVVDGFDCAIATCESTPGSYAARNRGIALARGEIIAFTDADCIPANDWIEKGVSHLVHNPDCGLIAGRIEIFFEELNQATSVSLYEKVTAFPQEQLLNKFNAGATANVFTFKTVMDQVGWFNSNLKSRGDLEWGKRVYASGYQQVYADDVQVLHPARSSYRDLYKRTTRLVGGIYDLQMGDRSFLQRNLLFFIELAKQLVPPLMFFWNTLFDPRLPGLDQKLKVSWVMVLVRYISAWEMIRLKLGGVSARG